MCVSVQINSSHTQTHITRLNHHQTEEEKMKLKKTHTTAGNSLRVYITDIVIIIIIKTRSADCPEVLRPENVL